MPSSQEHNTANPRSYDPISMSLHWLTALLVLAAFIMGPGGSEQRVYSAAKDFEREIHEVLGLAVFVLALLRLGWKPFARTPQRPELPGWMTLAAQVVQGLLYVLLIATPITAVLGAWLAGHPLTLGIRAAKTRLTSYWNTNKMATLAIVMTSADYEYGCGNDMNTLASEAYASAFNGNPRISTDIVGFNMDTTMLNAFETVRLNGWGAGSFQGNSNARVDMKNAMTFIRGQEKTMAFYVNPPANGETVDDRTFKFYLNADGSETLIPNAGAQSGCGSSAQGYWLTRPEGATGRIRINLCPGTVGVAAAAYSISGRVVYDCVETFPATATFSRDFDLTRCFSAGLVPRVTRLDWTTTQSSNTAVNFRLRLAAQKSLLSTATVAASGSALAWVPASISTYLDLSTATVPYNYGWARVEMDLLSSTDLITSPTVNNWKLTFTCTDGS